MLDEVIASAVAEMGVDWASLSDANKLKVVKLLNQRRHVWERRLFYRMFPDTDLKVAPDPIMYPDGLIFARDKYKKQLEFFRAGATHPQRCFMAANRVGKTIAGAYEVTAHLIGDYPHWWEGRRFNDQIHAWAAGKKNETTRDIVQAILLGKVLRDGQRKTVSGTGMVPGDLIRLDTITWKQGVADLVDTVEIKHVPSGKHSVLGFKAYEQGRGAFEGTAQHVIWPDEEPPSDVHEEMLMRLTTTKGIMLITFTPLEGISDVVLKFLPADYQPAGGERARHQHQTMEMA